MISSEKFAEIEKWAKGQKALTAKKLLNHIKRECVVEVPAPVTPVVPAAPAAPVDSRRMNQFVNPTRKTPPVETFETKNMVHVRTEAASMKADEARKNGKV